MVTFLTFVIVPSKTQVDGVINDHRLQHKDISIVNLVSVSRERDKTA